MLLETISNTQDMNYKTPIEVELGIDDKGMTTARKLYQFLELAPQNYSRWVKSNIIDNEFAAENEDYFYSSSMKNEQADLINYTILCNLSGEPNDEQEIEIVRAYWERIEE